MQQAGTRRGAAAAKFPPLFCQSATGKIRTALSPGALYPPFNVHCKFPYYQLVVVYVPTVTAALPKICHPRHASYQNHSSRFLTGGAGMGREFLEHIERFSRARFPITITFIT